MIGPRIRNVPREKLTCNWSGFINIKHSQSPAPPLLPSPLCIYYCACIRVCQSNKTSRYRYPSSPSPFCSRDLHLFPFLRTLSVLQEVCFLRLFVGRSLLEWGFHGVLNWPWKSFILKRVVRSEHSSRKPGYISIILEDIVENHEVSFFLVTSVWFDTAAWITTNPFTHTIII